MVMRDARYWSRSGEPVVGMLGCWARVGRATTAKNAMTVGVIQRHRMAEMLPRARSDCGSAGTGHAPHELLDCQVLGRHLLYELAGASRPAHCHLCFRVSVLAEVWGGAAHHPGREA